MLDAELFASIADHTLLDASATPADIDEFLVNARTLNVQRVCLNPSVLPVDHRGLEIVTVVGFPSGAHHAEIKAQEAARAIADGAAEIDMVINLGEVRAQNWVAVEGEIRAVRRVTLGKVLKVIIESAALSEEEIVGACAAVRRAEADFVKTSTGFHPAGGATAQAVRLMAETVRGELGVKASGGIRSAVQARELWAAGATRFGVSGTAGILNELASSQEVGQGAETHDHPHSY